MRKVPVVTVAVFAIALAVSGIANTANAQAGATHHSASPPRVARACASPAKAGVMSCMAEIRTDIKQGDAIGSKASPRGYGPADLQSVYGLAADGGAGQTVAIVDAYDDPKAEQDLNTYRKQFGLGTASLQKLNQSGQSKPLPAADYGWSEEISIDIDMVSAIAPKAKILLVEANSDSSDDLGAAENAAVAAGAKFVSNSWDGFETANTLADDDKYFKHPGVAITVSSGDYNYYGAHPQWPATSRYTISVGGTSLTGSPGNWTQKAWSNTGSGCSTNEPKPSWQTAATGCTTKAAADVSAVADLGTGVAFYDTYQDSGWMVGGGTSVSSPIIASVYADAGTPGAADQPATYPWAHPDQLTDVTTGSNGTCDTKQWCNADPGWDGPTGLGTPKGLGAFKPATG